MSVTSATKGRTVPGGKFRLDVDVIGDASYPTGGYPITPALFGLNVIEDFNPTCFSAIPPAAVADFVYDRANAKLILLASAGTQVTAATNVSAVKIKAVVIGA